MTKKAKFVTVAFLLSTLAPAGIAFAGCFEDCNQPGTSASDFALCYTDCRARTGGEADSILGT